MEQSDRNLKVAFQPDESYYIGQRKLHPDLAIEVIITSGDIDKLEKYKRLNIREVWFWEDQLIQVYCLRRQAEAVRYEAVSQSELLADLDLKLLARCVLLGDGLAAQDLFLQGL